MSTTIRVSDESRRRAAHLAERTGRHMQSVVEDALIAYERSLFWSSFEAGYQRLAADPDAWTAMIDERRAEETSLSDGVA